MSGCNCKVCGEYFHGVSTHYGGQACPACGAFFIRSPTAKHPYSCNNDDMCLAIPSKKGAKCKKCRLNKCFEIGMQAPSVQQSDVFEAEISVEYLIHATKLNSMFILLLNNPQLLYNFFAFNDPKLLHDANAIYESNSQNNVQPLPYVRKWATIFQSNQIPLPEMHMLIYAIMATVKFPWLSIQEQHTIGFIQQQAFINFIQPYPYSSQEVKDGFVTLTTYFQKEFEKYFVS